jgi:hypothetical protein
MSRAEMPVPVIEAEFVVIASAAKQSSFSCIAAKLDCFVADAPRNDGKLVRRETVFRR